MHKGQRTRRDTAVLPEVDPEVDPEVEGDTMKPSTGQVMGSLPPPGKGTLSKYMHLLASLWTSRVSGFPAPAGHALSSIEGSIEGSFEGGQL